ncbi:hypothetical protein AAFF_G00422340 [Aldrovandia affinis]|uniref:Uncharacterized protein n=1 Tax=Aldrovandia affinis TaxID=143900 RepID=A0AAD7T6B9_9TELE|nr:hypothetical protein AAFF_G00422340 [Aldrovandia affinis]
MVSSKPSKLRKPKRKGDFAPAAIEHRPTSQGDRSRPRDASHPLPHIATLDGTDTQTRNQNSRTAAEGSSSCVSQADGNERSALRGPAGLKSFSDPGNPSPIDYVRARL